MHLLMMVGEVKESLTWFLGNCFALAVWWVISGVVSGIFLALFGGTITFMLTGKFQSQKQIESRIGVIGGTLVGASGGATVGTIADFSGLLGLIYLWGFVGMLYSTFLGAYSQSLGQHRFDEDWDQFDSPDNPSDRTISVLDDWSATFGKMATTENHADELFGAGCGLLVGLIYGLITSLMIPLSTRQIVAEDTSHTVMGSVVIWVLLAGFGGWVGARRIGSYAGLISLVTGLVVGSSIGGMLALVGQVFGDLVCGALNGAIGGAFFGQLAAAELSNRRFLN